MNKDKEIKYIYPKNPSQYDNMFRTAFYIGKFLLCDLKSRTDKFIEWIKKLKDINAKIRKVYSTQDLLYDIEIFDNKINKWIRVGEISSKALKQEIQKNKK